MKSIFLIPKTALMLCLLLFAGCDKSTGVDEDGKTDEDTKYPIDAANPDIYLFGYHGSNSSNRSTGISYWVNGERHLLPESEEYQFYKAWMEGEDMYVVGSSDRTVPGYADVPIFNMKYWKNGEPSELISWNRGQYTIRDIFISDGMVYAVGTTGTEYTLSQKACYWANGMRYDLKIDVPIFPNGRPNAHPQFTDIDINHRGFSGTKIRVSEGNVYVLGNARLENSDADFGVLWKNGVLQRFYGPDDKQGEPTADWIVGYIAHDIFIANGDIYVLGGKKTQFPIAIYGYACPFVARQSVYWKNEEKISRVLGDYGDWNAGGHHWLHISGNDVYIAASVTRDDCPVRNPDRRYLGLYWKNGVEHVLENSESLVDLNSNPNVNFISTNNRSLSPMFVYDGDVYILAAGTTISNPVIHTIFKGSYWKNGTLHDFGLNLSSTGEPAGGFRQMSGIIVTKGNEFPRLKYPEDFVEE